MLKNNNSFLIFKCFLIASITYFIKFCNISIFSDNYNYLNSSHYERDGIRDRYHVASKAKTPLLEKYSTNVDEVLSSEKGLVFNDETGMVLLSDSVKYDNDFLFSRQNNNIYSDASGFGYVNMIMQYFGLVIQIFFFMLAFGILIEILLRAFSAKLSLVNLTVINRLSAHADVGFILLVTAVVVNCGWGNCGYMINNWHLVAQGILPMEVFVRLQASQWFWTVYVHTNVVNPFLMCSVSHDTDYRDLLLAQEDVRDMPRYEARYILVPYQTDITFVGNSIDVIHSFGVNGTPIKFDCVPGKTQTCTYSFEQSGFYLGKCYELCGQRHAYMNLGILAITREAFYQHIINVGYTYLDFENPVSAELWT